MVWLWLVVLTGVCDIKTDKGNFTEVGYRREVFGGLPYALYMPRNTEFEIEAKTESLGREFRELHELPTVYHNWNELTAQVFLHSYEVVTRQRAKLD